jgi:hypothetical protein
MTGPASESRAQSSIRLSESELLMYPAARTTPAEKGI